MKASWSAQRALNCLLKFSLIDPNNFNRKGYNLTKVISNSFRLILKVFANILCKLKGNTMEMLLFKTYLIYLTMRYNKQCLKRVIANRVCLFRVTSIKLFKLMNLNFKVLRSHFLESTTTLNFKIRHLKLTIIPTIRCLAWIKPWLDPQISKA